MNNVYLSLSTCVGMFSLAGSTCVGMFSLAGSTCVGAVSLPNGFSQPQVVNLDSKPGEIRNIIADVCVDRNRISLGEVLMEGQVYR